MPPHTKKVVMMAAISLGIIMFAYMFAYMIPVYVVPVALGVSEIASCTDYGCANTTFNECGGFSAEGDSSNFMDSWTRGMEGMLCMIGIDTGASINVSAEQITLNKV
jgi:hypothetical protein